MMNKPIMRPDPKSHKEWKSVLIQEKPFVEEVINIVLDPKFSIDEVSILI